MLTPARINLPYGCRIDVRALKLKQFPVANAPWEQEYWTNPYMDTAFSGRETASTLFFFPVTRASSRSRAPL